MDENIRSKLKTSSILFAVIFVFLGVFCFYNVISRLYKGITNDEMSDIIIVSLFGAFFVYKFIKNVIVILDINKHKVIKKYGNIENLENIIKAINKTVIYKDKKIIISNNYIADIKNYKKIFHFDDIINVYQFIQRTNGFETATDLVIINKAGKETHIAYGLYKDDLLKALNTIAITRDDIKIGYIR